MPGPRLPAQVAKLAADLSGVAGVVAVVLGGSRASATHRPDTVERWLAEARGGRFEVRRPPSSPPPSRPSAACWAPSRCASAETRAARRDARYETGAGAG
jgi:hypothetical protein